VDQACIRAYNQGDAKTLASMFADDAEVVGADDEKYRGRAEIERGLSETFASSPGARLEIAAEAIQFLSPEVAKEEGRTRVVPPKGAPDARRHTALFVKRGGRWLISSLHEEPDPIVGAHERLKDLQWLVGEWVDEGSEGVVRVNCRWSDDQNYLLADYTIKVRGKPVMTISQRIAWDPAIRQFHSWDFNSEGGFGEGKWSRYGERWIIKHTGVQPDGMPASATNMVYKERSDLVRWVSTDRVVGDEAVPEGEAYTMVRVAPRPGGQAKGQGPSSSSSNTTRSPQ
jgi:uncharacterized protein (TIGR02246 family)